MKIFKIETLSDQSRFLPRSTKNNTNIKV